MKPYSGKLHNERTDFAKRGTVSPLRTFPEILLQISASAAGLWSVAAFMFGIGFISRIDPSILQILTITDVLGLSLSYAIYLVPLAVVIALWPYK